MIMRRTAGAAPAVQSQPTSRPDSEGAGEKAALVQTRESRGKRSQPRSRKRADRQGSLNLLPSWAARLERSLRDES